jgi:hypothetical protein
VTLAELEALNLDSIRELVAASDAELVARVQELTRLAHRAALTQHQANLLLPALDNLRQHIDRGIVAHHVLEQRLTRKPYSIHIAVPEEHVNEDVLEAALETLERLNTRLIQEGTIPPDCDDVHALERRKPQG